MYPTSLLVLSVVIFICAMCSAQEAAPGKCKAQLTCHIVDRVGNCPTTVPQNFTVDQDAQVSLTCDATNNDDIRDVFEMREAESLLLYEGQTFNGTFFKSKYTKKDNFEADVVVNFTAINAFNGKTFTCQCGDSSSSTTVYVTDVGLPKENANVAVSVSAPDGSQRSTVDSITRSFSYEPRACSSKAMVVNVTRPAGASSDMMLRPLQPGSSQHVENCNSSIKITTGAQDMYSVPDTLTCDNGTEVTVDSFTISAFYPSDPTKYREYYRIDRAEVPTLSSPLPWPIIIISIIACGFAVLLFILICFKSMKPSWKFGDTCGPCYTGYIVMLVLILLILVTLAVCIIGITMLNNPCGGNESVEIALLVISFLLLISGVGILLCYRLKLACFKSGQTPLPDDVDGKSGSGDHKQKSDGAGDTKLELQTGGANAARNGSRPLPPLKNPGRHQAGHENLSYDYNDDNSDRSGKLNDRNNSAESTRSTGDVTPKAKEDIESIEVK